MDRKLYIRKIRNNLMQYIFDDEDTAFFINKLSEIEQFLEEKEQNYVREIDSNINT